MDKIKSKVDKACQQPKQGRWTAWNTSDVRELSWKDVWTMSEKRISLLLKSSYDLLGTPANLKLWGMQSDDKCGRCGQVANLKHILTNCSVSLNEGRYTWRHDTI